MAFRKGYGQVEPNHLSGIVEGRIYAQLPCADAMLTVNGDETIKYLENGRFAKYDLATGAVNTTGAGEWFLVYNEEKHYDERKQNHRHFAMELIADEDGNFHGEIYPRLIATEVGDIFTTNTFDNAVDTGDLTIGTTVKINTNGFLAVTGGVEGSPEFKVVKNLDGTTNTTMPDGQFGVRLQRIG